MINLWCRLEGVKCKVFDEMPKLKTNFEEQSKEEEEEEKTLKLQRKTCVSWIDIFFIDYQNEQMLIFIQSRKMCVLTQILYR